MAPNDRHDDTLQRAEQRTFARGTLPADLQPVDELLRELCASWQRQLPSSDALDAQLPLLLQDAPNAHPNLAAPRTRLALRDRQIGQEGDTGTLDRISRLGATSSTAPAHRWFSAVAALLVIALGVSVFGVFAAHRPSPDTTVLRPTAPAITRILAPQPQNTRLPLPTDGAISSLSFSSATDGWAGGNILIPDVQGADWSKAQGYFVRYHEGQWTRSSETYPGAGIAAISMVSADEGWAIGTTNWDQATNTNGHDFLLHYTGGHWHNLGTFVPQDTLLTDLHMSVAGWGYATGSANVPVPGQSSVEQVLAIAVYQAGTWRMIQTSFQAFSTHAVMVSPDEGWAAVGDEHGSGAIYHYQHGTWTSVAVMDGIAYGLSMASPQDMWALGVKCGPAPTPSTHYPSAQLCLLNPYHFDGSTWSRVPSPDPVTILTSGSVNGYYLAADETSAAWIAIAHTAQDPKSPDMWQYTSDLYHFASGRWSKLTLPVPNVNVASVVSDHNGGTWALALGVHPDKGYCLYYDGTAWHIYGRWLAA